MSEKRKLSYAKAIQELEHLVSEIEAESVDIDVLAEKVRRAAYLIKFCKGNLRTTEEEVKKTLSEIEERLEEETDEGSGDADSEPF
jgi:exodeoxyribonuclease VII small subunit